MSTRAPSANRRLGRAGEEHAARWLEERGVRIVARSYRRAGGEIDLVGRQGALWLIVEVKLRTSRRWGSAAEAVGRRKRHRLRATARRFLWEQGALGDPVRFDVVTLRARRGRLSVDWIRGAFDG